MKRGSLLKRMSANREPRGRLIGGGAANEEMKGTEKYKPCNTTTRSLGKHATKPAKGGGLFSRFVNRRKKAPQQQQVPEEKLLLLTTPKPDRRIDARTPITVGTGSGDDGIEVPLTIPCERVPSYAETTQTHEISDYSGQAEDETLQNRTRSFKRASSTKTHSSRMILDTSGVPIGKSRSLRSLKLARRTGNESLGDSKPNQPRRGALPPLLGDDEEESVGQSSCSGLTMDFTYEEMKAPALQPVGRLGEGVPQTRKHNNSFVPPTFITMDDEDQDDLDLPMYGDM